MATHRIHEIHLLLSVILGFSLSIAPAGHLSAHNPHAEHEAFAFGLRPALDSLYGLLQSG